MGAQEAPEAASVMAVLPWGMLCTAVSYPGSDSLESHTACPSWCFFLQSESIFPTNILSLPVCKLLIPSPCKPLVAHESIPSLVSLVPLREIHRAQLLPLAERWQFLGFSADFSFSLSGLFCALPVCEFGGLLSP